MNRKRAILFPSLLFGVLFLLIATAGFFQGYVIERNIRALLRSEAEILADHITREINTNLEYLSALDEHPSIITPRFLNVLAYDEAIVDYLYGLLRSAGEADIERVPVSGMAEFGTDGRLLAKKGSISLPEGAVRGLVTGKRESFVKMPDIRDGSIIVGLRAGDRSTFLSLGEKEVRSLRRRLVVREALEDEGKRFNVAGLRILDQANNPYVSLAPDPAQADTFLHVRRMDSRFLPGYVMEITLSKRISSEMLRRTVVNFVLILCLLALFGGLSIYGIHHLERRYEGRMKELEHDLEMKERLVSLGRLASGMAHEIKNPLNAISMSVQRLKREFVPATGQTEEYGRFLDIMRSELSRVDRIVEDFLLSAKARAPFLPENLGGLVEEVAILLREKAHQGRIQLTSGVDGDIVVECQRERLKQVFYNVLLNALEAVGERGAVDLRARQDGDRALIDVRDSGPGISRDRLLTIFEYHYTTKDKGMGLGLPISFLIVKDHGGDITVTSEEGKGSTFHITLPLSHRETDRGAEKALDPATRGSEEKGV